jgi:hypothetical protein
VTDEGRMAYIDSELAKRRVEGVNAVQSSQQQWSAPSRLDMVREASSNVESKKEVEVQRQPAALGKLLEIDLGDEARSKNVERTEQARRKLDGEEVEEEDKPGKPGKVRLGRDGKPWRGRKRRGSDDVKRDKLVDEVLRENRCKSFKYFRPHERYLLIQQWKSTKSRLWNLRLSTMIRLQMIGLQKHLGKSSWMLCPPDRERRQLLHHLLVGLWEARRRKRF